VSVIGPLLGGGHGNLQGQHGLIADQLVSARVVLANGTAVTASATENKDLYWALRGAGHNFGIVSSFEVNLFDVPVLDSWVVATYTFKQDKLGKILEHVNTLTEKGKHPPELSLQGILGRTPEIDPKDVGLPDARYVGRGR